MIDGGCFANGEKGIVQLRLIAAKSVPIWLARFALKTM
ncbi:hypothetical protein SSU98_1910 [Streptococcus suis 98HAH33]|nr:hypothetical protein SSU05_1908 [Streptococcus suis 05ZYH33]ABP93068.1 hypothetical protein SSU98_1910 [Streptococcus suis 98HAH33]